MVALLRKKPASEVEGFTSPERAALAHAIAALADAKAQHARTDEAIQRANSTVWDRTAALTAGERAIVQAREDDQNQAITFALARGETGPLPKTEKEARAAFAKLQEELQDAKDLREGLSARLSPAAAVCDRRAAELEKAQRAVVGQEAGKYAAALADEIAAMQVTMARKLAELSWLVHHNTMPQKPGTYGWHHIENATARKVLSRAMAPPREWAAEPVEGSYIEIAGSLAAGGTEAWDAALAALATDAAAPLPL